MLTLTQYRGMLVGHWGIVLWVMTEHELYKPATALLRILKWIESFDNFHPQHLFFRYRNGEQERVCKNVTDSKYGNSFEHSDIIKGILTNIYDRFIDFFSPCNRFFRKTLKHRWDDAARQSYRVNQPI